MNLKEFRPIGKGKMGEDMDVFMGYYDDLGNYEQSYYGNYDE